MVAGVLFSVEGSRCWRTTDWRARSSPSSVNFPAPLRNQARFVFLNPHARELYADWNEVAADTVAMLRLDAGRYRSC